jgi:hypothetical protein
VTAIREAQQRGDCRDCVWRVVGPGPMQCMGAELAEADCAGRTTREEMREKGDENGLA